MTNQTDGDPDVEEEILQECRACLKKLDDRTSTCNVFQAWSLSWPGMEATIAEDLAKLANVEISITDRHSKVICSACYQNLQNAAKFAANVRSCDLLLRQRFTDEIDIERVWPKPIQVDKNINRSVFTNTLDVEIKQEVLSDEEQGDAYIASGTEHSYVEAELSNLDIKIEPEEMVEQPPMNITINGTISLNPLNSETKALTNGTDLYHDNRFMEVAVKQEPMSDDDEFEQASGVPLECLLCTKSFRSVSGLKAHVIAQHSYKSVKRKSDGSVSPMKKCIDLYQCMICRRNFKTPTDLMVHETCHNKHSCYVCMKKFDSFELLTRHRKLCKSFAKAMPRVRTLEDVKRTHPEPQPTVAEETLVVEIQNRIEMPKVTDFEMKDASGDSIEAKEGDETLLVEIKEEVDSNMELFLEIHSTESEREKAIDDANIQAETVTNDES